MCCCQSWVFCGYLSKNLLENSFEIIPLLDRSLKTSKYSSLVTSYLNSSSSTSIANSLKKTVPLSTVWNVPTATGLDFPLKFRWVRRVEMKSSLHWRILPWVSHPSVPTSVSGVTSWKKNQYICHLLPTFVIKYIEANNFCAWHKKSNPY